MGNRSSLLEPFVEEKRLARIDEVLKNRIDSLVLVLEGVRNPHNVSAVLRSADAFGINQVYLLGSEFSYSPGVSLGTEKWLEVEQFEKPSELLKKLKNEDFKLVTLQPEDDTRSGDDTPSLSVMELPFEEKLALVFGNEHRGVSKELAEQTDLHAFIPMYGFVESFNISVACAITLFCSTIKGASAERRGQVLSEGKLDSQRTEWLSGSIRAGEQILKRLEDEE